MRKGSKTRRTKQPWLPLRDMIAQASLRPKAGQRRGVPIVGGNSATAADFPVTRRRSPLLSGGRTWVVTILLCESRCCSLQ